MKARIERDAFKRALRTVMPAVSTKAGPGAVTTGVLIETVDGDGLRLVGTNLETTITCEVDAKALDAGRIVAPARLLSNYIDRCPEGSVELVESKGRLCVTARDSTFDLNLFTMEGWPRIGPLTGEPFTLLTAEHIDLIRRVAPFRDTRGKFEAHLSGVHLAGNTAGATDSYGMGLATLGGADIPPVTVPGDTLLMALKDATEVELRANESKVTISHNAASWTTVLLEGKFPDLSLFMQRLTKGEHELTLATSQIVESLGRTALLDEKGKPVRIRQDGDQVHVSIVEPDLGTIEDVIGCSGSFPESEMGFNSSLLAAVIEAVAGDAVTLEAVDHLKPVVARGENIVALVMPVRPPVKVG